jgi:hypothetical protein
MPLRIKSFDDNHLPVLNRWANSQETVTSTHTTQINQLQGALDNLLKNNPSLKSTGK